MGDGFHDSSSIHRGMSPVLANGQSGNRVLGPKSKSFTSNSLSTKKSSNGRKLVLHFDVRNTVLVADSVDNISVEQALNSFLTGVTWGKDTERGWKWHNDHPSLSPPHPDVITYYKHLEKQMVTVPSDRVKLRRYTGEFTEEEMGKEFAPYFHKHLQYLEWPFHENNENHKKLTMAGKDGTLYHYILPAFYKLIYHLYSHKRDFCIILRTYGLDGPNVLESIKLTLQGKHPQFPEALPMKVCTKTGRVCRKEGVISLEPPRKPQTTPCPIQDERVIYNHLTNTEGICGYKDDFQFWQQNDYDHQSAKPLWIDPSQTDVHHIIFDDNIRVFDSDSIVDVRVFDSVNSTKAVSLDKHDAALFEDMCLVQANLLESTSNSDYFIDKLAICERNYSDYLKSK